MDKCVKGQTNTFPTAAPPTVQPATNSCDPTITTCPIPTTASPQPTPTTTTPTSTCNPIIPSSCGSSEPTTPDNNTSQVGGSGASGIEENQTTTIPSSSGNGTTQIINNLTSVGSNTTLSNVSKSLSLSISVAKGQIVRGNP